MPIANATGSFSSLLLKLKGSARQPVNTHETHSMLLGGLSVGLHPYQVTGYSFLNKINTVPSLEGMAQMITRTSNDIVGRF